MTEWKREEKHTKGVNNPSTSGPSTTGGKTGKKRSVKPVRGAVSGDVPTPKGIQGVPGSKNPDRRCSATVRSTGLQCKRAAIKGGSVCTTHGGNAPQVKKKAKERLLELVDPALAALHKVLANPDTEDAVKVRASLGILDRTGFRPGLVVEHEPSDKWMDTLKASLGLGEADQLSTDDIEDDRSLGGGTDTTPEIEAANMHQHAYDERLRQWAPLIDEDRAAFEAGRVDNTGHRVVQAEPAEGWSPIPPPAVPPPETEHDRTPPGAGVQSREEMLMERLGEQDRDDRRRGWRRR